MSAFSAKLPPLREVIEAFELRAKKSFGQHFLLDQNITDKIVRRAGVDSSMHVVEVGPGPGGLTRSIIASEAASVHVIEKDARCIPVMEQLRAFSEGKLHIHEGDALEIDPREIATSPRAIIANLPYNVGTQMVLQWLAHLHADIGAYTHISVMLQQEVVERILAKPRSKAYGRLSVMAQWICDVEMLMHLPPQAFSPPPKVDSAVVQLRGKTRIDKLPFKAMESLVQTAFNQRRKMLRASLKPLGVDTTALCAKANIDETLRADQLSVEEYVRLAEAYAAD